MIKLAKPNISEDAINDVVEVLISGSLVQGKNVVEFENKLSNYLNSKNVICVSSGTAALHLSLMALDIKENDEVIVPAFTFPATANVVEVMGAKSVFVDINLDDFCINTEKIEDKITKNTKAIIPVHEFGQPARIDKIKEIAEKYNLKIIEDAACAIGSEYKNKKIGTFGDIGCFSLHPRKAITTGEGGIICTDDDALALKIKSLRNHGISYNDGKMDFIYAGLNYRLTDFQAVLGKIQLDNLENDIELRITLSQIYNQKFQENNFLKMPAIFENRRMVFQTYHVLLGEKIQRDELISFLNKNQIETNLGAQALNCLTYFKNKYKITEEEFPNATYAFKKGIALPIGNHVSIDDIDYITQKIKSYCYEY